MAGNDAAASIQACAMRVSRLAASGAVAVGPNNMIVTNALIKVDSKKVVEAGDDFVSKNACGGIFIAYKSGDMLKRYDVTVTLPNPDPELEEMLTGGSLVTSAGQSVGYSAPAVGGVPSDGVCLEVWSKAWIGGGPPPGATFADAATTSASPNLTSATAAFTSADVGRTISGAGIPGGTTILTVTSGTAIVMSANATATATGVSITIGRPGAYHRFVWPHWLPGPDDFSVEGAPKQGVFSGPTFENPAIGNGPTHDWPTGLLATAGRSYSHFRDSGLPSLTTIGYQATT